MPEYSHTLVPQEVHYAPSPTQASDFLSALTELGAAPLNPTLKLITLSGLSRSFVNPFTGQLETHPLPKHAHIESLKGIAAEVAGLDHYSVVMSGKGPPNVHPLEFDFEGPYDFAVYCSLRATPVSMSDWHDEVPINRKVAFFGNPCSPEDRIGLFHDPNTLKIIEVPNAGCARFWIEFEFGKMLFPEINERLDLLDVSIVEIASKAFGVGFVQGCHWCA
jgi:hypothetical protein